MSHNFFSLDDKTPTVDGAISSTYTIIEGNDSLSNQTQYHVPSGTVNEVRLRLADSPTAGDWVTIHNSSEATVEIYIRNVDGTGLSYPDGTGAPITDPIIIAQYYGIHFEGRGTINVLCYTDSDYVAFFTPAVEMSLNAIGAGDSLKYNDLTKQFESGGISRTTKLLSGNVSASSFVPYMGYETLTTETNVRTITFPDYLNNSSLWGVMDGRDFIIDNKGTANVNLSIADTSESNRYSYFRHRWGTVFGDLTGLSVVNNDEAVISAGVKVKVCPYYFQSGIKFFVYYQIGILGKITTTVTTNYTVNFGYEDERFILVNNGANNVTITLADTSTQTWAGDIPLTIKRLGSGSVTVECSGSDVIDGTVDTSFTVTNQYDAVRLTAVASTGYYKI